MLTDGLTDGWTEKQTPISHPATSRCDKNHLPSQNLDLSRAAGQWICQALHDMYFSTPELSQGLIFTKKSGRSACKLLSY